MTRKVVLARDSRVALVVLTRTSEHRLSPRRMFVFQHLSTLDIFNLYNVAPYRRQSISDILRHLLQRIDNTLNFINSLTNRC